MNSEIAPSFRRNGTPWQGSFVVDALTDIVEEAVYKEFEALSERGGVLGAMDTLSQRGKIQEESMYYEHRKHDGSLPLIGVNTFLPKDHGGEIATTIELIRSAEPEKAQQITNVRAYQSARNVLALASALEPSPPGRGQGEGTRSDVASGSNRIASQTGAPGLSLLKSTARDRKNIFAALMEAVKTHSLGQISHALYEVGGEYRRNM